MIQIFNLIQHKMLKLSKYRGVLAVIGPEIDQIVNQHLLSADLSSVGKVPEVYHLTVVTSQEFKALDSKDPGDPSFQFDFQLVDLGIGQVKNGTDVCFFVVVYSYELQAFRQKLNLPKHDFHITLGYTGANIHNLPKDISSLRMLKHPPHYFTQLLKLVEHASFKPELDTFHLELLNQEYLSGLYYQAKSNLKRLGLKATYEYLRDSVLAQKWKYLESTPTPEIYGPKIQKILNYAIIGRFEKFARYYSYELIEDTSGKYFQFSYEELPRNFSFITDKLAGSSLLKKRQHLKMLIELGIKTVITVMEHPLDPKLYLGLDLNYHWFEVEDRTPPTIEQMKAIMKLIDNNPNATVVHCMGGVGRTATVLSAYLMWSKGQSKVESKVPLQERKTILSQSQEDFLSDWYGVCQSDLYYKDTAQAPTQAPAQTPTQAPAQTPTQAPAPAQTPTQVAQTPTQAPAPAQTPTQVAQVAQAPVVSKLSVKLPPFIMMVGYPASGKSTLSKALEQADERFFLINQDELGRKECESLAGLAKKPHRITILDRCHLNPTERREWLNLTHNLKTWCIYFDVDIEECQWRITRRQNHPGIKPGGGTQILKSLANKLIPPTEAEGFEKIIRLDSFEAVNNLLNEWNCPLPSPKLFTQTSNCSESETSDNSPLIKFPRTRHLQNLGSATRDDLIMDKSEVNEFLNRPIYIEEKIDGANLGISLQNNQIMVQNRSHYVNASYHSQFKYLDKWVYQHTAELWDILKPDIHILYGEWVYAKHSIKYTNLPDYFVAFDLYDRVQNRFWSRERLESCLAPTTIKLIPLIAYKSFKNSAELQSLVQTPSKFYEGPVEGAYARICDENWLIKRGKIVRSDFLSGNTHWKQNQLEPNQLKLNQ